eukprot:EG_transcript_3080
MPRIMDSAPLELPSAQASEAMTIIINGKRLTACFGDLFQLPPGTSTPWIPMVPHYTDGVLYRAWQLRNRSVDPDYNIYAYPDPSAFLTLPAEPATADPDTTDPVGAPPDPPLSVAIGMLSDLISDPRFTPAIDVSIAPPMSPPTSPSAPDTSSPGLPATLLPAAATSDADAVSEALEGETGSFAHEPAAPDDIPPLPEDIHAHSPAPEPPELDAIDADISEDEGLEEDAAVSEAAAVPEERLGEAEGEGPPTGSPAGPLAHSPRSAWSEGAAEVDTTAEDGAEMTTVTSMVESIAANDEPQPEIDAPTQPVPQAATERPVGGEDLTPEPVQPPAATLPPPDPPIGAAESQAEAAGPPPTEGLLEPAVLPAADDPPEAEWEVVDFPSASSYAIVGAEGPYGASLGAAAAEALVANGSLIEVDPDRRDGGEADATAMVVEVDGSSTAAETTTRSPAETGDAMDVGATALPEAVAVSAEVEPLAPSPTPPLTEIDAGPGPPPTAAPPIGSPLAEPPPGGPPTAGPGPQAEASSSGRLTPATPEAAASATTDPPAVPLRPLTQDEVDHFNALLLRAHAYKLRGYVAIRGIYRCPSLLPGIPCAILFSYEDRAHIEWWRIFEEAAELAEDGAVLVVPTIGTNNKMTFFQSAICTFTAIRSCLQREDSALQRLAEVRIVTPWTECPNQSSRTIQHLFNLMERHGQENTCLVCCEAKTEILLPCGHRILCELCATNIFHASPMCPLCRKRFTLREMYRTPKLEDCEARHCCEESGPKQKKVMVPCCCFKVCCDHCEQGG